jgi:hypothetical protein
MKIFEEMTAKKENRKLTGGDICELRREAVIIPGYLEGLLWEEKEAISFVTLNSRNM